MKAREARRITKLLNETTWTDVNGVHAIYMPNPFDKVSNYTPTLDNNTAQWLGKYDKSVPKYKPKNQEIKQPQYKKCKEEGCDWNTPYFDYCINHFSKNGEGKC